MRERLAFEFFPGGVSPVGAGAGDPSTCVQQITPTRMIDRALPRIATSPGE